MCRLTLAWVTSEYSTSNWNADILTQSSSLDPIFSATVSGVDRICPWFHANSSADSPLCCPVANSCQLLCPANSFASPYHFRIRRDFRSKNPLFGFALKQTKESSAVRATHIVLHWEFEVKAETTDYFSAKITKGDNCLHLFDLSHFRTNEQVS